MIKLILTSCLLITLTWTGCKKPDVSPICFEKQYGSIRVENEGRDEFLISIPSASVSATIDVGGYLLVNNVPKGSQEVRFLNQSDSATGTFFVDVQVCDTVTVQVK